MGVLDTFPGIAGQPGMAEVTPAAEEKKLSTSWIIFLVVLGVLGLGIGLWFANTLREKRE